MGTPKRPALRITNEQDILARMRGTQDRIADAITAWAGTMGFVYLHALWFTVWIVCNEGVFGEGAIWDPYPFGLLTMIVSLEAIFLSTFVMVSQNRQAARENVPAAADLLVTVETPGDSRISRRTISATSTRWASPPTTPCCSGWRPTWRCASG
ncbi:DUF1003 domain-containing protein [Streptomyces sp. NPDC005921]